MARRVRVGLPALAVGAGLLLGVLVPPLERAPHRTIATPPPLPPPSAPPPPATEPVASEPCEPDGDTGVPCPPEPAHEPRP